MLFCLFLGSVSVRFSPSVFLYDIKLGLGK